MIMDHKHKRLMEPVEGKSAAELQEAAAHALLGRQTV